MDRTLRLVLTLLAVITGLSAAPVAARMNGSESAEVERVEPAGRSVVGAIKAAVAAAPPSGSEATRLRECRWQRDQLPEAVRELVLDDQRRRNHLCWSVFDC